MACVHHFVIPTAPALPVGVCRKCGQTRDHGSNVPSIDNYSVWKKTTGIKRRALPNNTVQVPFRLPDGVRLYPMNRSNT